MFTFKNAVKNIYRYKSRYILFSIWYFILILAAAVTVNIFVQTTKANDYLLKECAGVARFGTKTVMWENDYQPRLSKNEFMQYENMEHIQDIQFLKYIFSTNYKNNTHNREEFPDLTVDAHISGDVIPLGFYAIVAGYNLPLFNLTADGFDTTEFNLEKGRMFENDSECVILNPNQSLLYWDASSIFEEGFETWINSSPLSGWSDLDIGDKIVIHEANKNEGGLYKEFTIVGILRQNLDDDIYRDTRMIYTTLESAEYFESTAPKKEYSENHVRFINDSDIGGWVRYNPLDEINLEGNSGSWTADVKYSRVERLYHIRMGYDALIYLDNPDNFNKLANNMLDMDDENMRVMIDPLFPNFFNATYLINYSKNTTIGFMVFTALLIVAIAIISTFILMNMRKYEIAVLLSCGMKKSRLVISYLIENLAFIWSISIGAFIAAQFIQRLFTVPVFAGIQGFVPIEFFKNLTHNVNHALLLQNAVIVLAGITAVVALSMMIACLNIIKFEPIKIFGKQY